MAAAAADGKAVDTIGPWQVPWRLEVIRQHNPDLDDEQAHRAHLCPPLGAETLADCTAAQWDSLVNSLSHRAHAGGPALPQLERVSRIKLNRRRVQLYTTDTSTAVFAAAARAGFFIFGSEFELPGAALEERSLVNLELCGEPTASAGRVVLEGVGKLTMGKRALRGLRATPPGPQVAAAAAPDAEGKHPALRAGSQAYSLTVSQCFDEVVGRIIAQHGVDWVGFAAVRGTLSRLAALRRGVGEPSVRVVSLELWSEPGVNEGDERGPCHRRLASAEIGYIVGSCYTCLSLFANEQVFPRCSRVRTKAVHLWLARAGVTLFDAGTTAAYYEHLHGYTRATRHKFVALWRAHRAVPLSTPEVLSQRCDDVYSLLSKHMARTPAPAHQTPTTASLKRGRSHDHADPASGARDKPAGVRVTWKSAVELRRDELSKHFADCGGVRKVVAARPGEAILIFETAAAAAKAIALPPSEVRAGSGILYAVALEARKRRRREGAAARR